MSSYLMFIAGSVLFIGGILETLIITELVNWVLFVPVGLSTTPGCILGLALTLSGLTLMVFGLAAGTHFSRARTWYIRELQNASSIEESLVARKKRKRKKVLATT